MIRRLTREAIEDAVGIVERLPFDSPWHLNITEDDDAESPASLNVFLSEEEWEPTLQVLRLGEHSDRGEDFVSWYRDALTVSLIEHQQEEQDDREPDA